MNQIRIPWREPIPAWYEIGIHDKTTLVIRIHPQALSLLDVLKSDSPIVKHCEKQFHLSNFVMPTTGLWGFEEVMQCVPDDKGWVAYHCLLPVYKKRGKNEMTEKSTAAAVRITLSILFELLRFCPEEDTDSGVPQLVIIDHLLVQDGPHGGSLTATLTPGMNAFLSNPGASSLESIRSTMRTADDHMWQDKKRGKLLASDFRVHLFNPSRIHLSVPGNACGLDPASNDGAYEGVQCGYRLSPHNVDGGIQQLSLLMGLARLHELGRAMYI